MTIEEARTMLENERRRTRCYKPRSLRGPAKEIRATLLLWHRQRAAAMKKIKAVKAWAYVGNGTLRAWDTYDTLEGALYWHGRRDTIIRVLITPIAPKKGRKPCRRNAR